MADGANHGFEEMGSLQAITSERRGIIGNGPNRRQCRRLHPRRPRTSQAPLFIRVLDECGEDYRHPSKEKNVLSTTCDTTINGDDDLVQAPDHTCFTG